MIDNIIHISKAVIAVGGAALIVGAVVFFFIIGIEFLRDFFHL